MSTYCGNVWKSLKFNSGQAVYQLGSGLRYRLPNDDGSDIIYKNPRYKNVFVHISKQLVMSQLEGELHKMFPKYQKYIENKMYQNALKQIDINNQILIKDRQRQNADWGRVTTSSGNFIIAKDKYGSPVPEALMLYYEGDEDIIVNDTVQIAANQFKSDQYKTKTVCHIDLSPQISMNSSKNIVMTKVQGRDYTRKELVSGGDLSFTVNGQIVSNQDGIYPTVGVQKFLQIMQHNGILDVNCMQLGVLGIKRVIVTGFSLGTVQFKNEQPYSFTCVAVEPDEEIKILKDTIGVLNSELKESSLNKWYKLILDNKLVEIASSSVLNTASDLAVQSAGMGLDALVPNI